ncbi:MAG TPA: hypothetical protein EYP29_00825, partial [Thermoplasmata archaeon]|nr:hypothetical protein [Thermoplasmata archaeon]
ASVYDWAEITQGSVINGLGAGETQTIQIRITVRPYDEDHDATPGPKNFWILVYSKTARDNGKEVLNTTTDLFRATVDVRPYYYVTVEPLTTNTPKLQVGENATFEISVKNLGNTPDTITMIKDGDAPTNGKYSRWQSFDKSSVYLQPDTSTTVNMTITVLPEKDAETGTYNFYFHAKSVGDPDVESQQKYNSIEIEENFGVNIEVTSEELTISPGEYAAFPIQVTNKGNSRTEITLVKPDVAYEDWEVYWSNSPESSTEIDTTGNLDPAQTTTVYLKIQPSSNTSKAIARSYTIPFKVKSGTGTDTVYDYGNVTINIERKYDIAVSASIDSDSIKPGEKTTYYVKVENRGNAWDNFTYEIIDQSKFNWVYLDETNVTKSTEEHPNGYNITTKEISLGPWQFLRVPFVVEIPPYSDENDDAEARINYRVDVKFISTGDSSVNDKQRLTTTVEQIYDVSIEAKNGKDTKEVKLKETGISYVDFILEVKNLGNGDDIFLIKVPSGELEGEKENWQIEFRRDGSVIPAQGFSLPTLTKEEITVTIGVDDRTAPDDYTLDIDVSSKGDTDVRKTVTLNLHCIKAEYGVKIEAVSEKNRWNQTANPADLPQNGIEYRFKVRNTGSQEDSFKLKVETNTGSGTYRGWEIMFDTELGLQDEMIVPTDVPGWTGGDTLEEDEEVEIRVYVKPPEDEDASGKDEDKYSDLEISAESQQDTSKTDTIFFRLIIIRPDLRIGPDDIRIDTTDKIQEGDTVDLEITIHNDGMAESGKFDVWVYKSKEDSLSGVGGTVGVGGLIAHEKDVESIDPESSYTLTIDWDIEWGKHEIYVYVDKPISTGADKTDDPDKGDVIEISERNNDAKMLSEYQQYVDLRPWIEISGIDWNKDPQKDETVTITVTIFNNDNKMAVASYGDSPNDPSDMYVRCKAGGEYLKPKKGTFTPETGYKVTEKIPAGEELEIEFEWKVTDDAGTEVKIKAYIDYSENKNDNDTDTIKLKIKEKSTGIAGFGETSTTTVMGMGGIIIILILIVLLLVVKGKKTKIPAGLEGVPPKKKEKKAKKEEKKKPPLKPGVKPPV